MSNTVINIYGDVNVGIVYNNEKVIGGNISPNELIEMIKGDVAQAKADINQVLSEASTHQSIPKSKSETPCYDYYGRWCNEAQRDAWRRFYRANGV